MADIPILPRLADGLNAGKGSNVTLGGGGFALTLPELLDHADHAINDLVIRFDKTNDGDLTFAAPTVTGGAIEGGVLRSMAATVAEQEYTLAATPTDEAVGTFFMARHNVTLNYAGPGATGPTPYTAYFGPRAAFNYEGMLTYNNGTTPYGLAPMGFGNFIGIRNKVSTAMALTPAWGFVHAPIYLADDATVTHNANDLLDGPAAFVDDSLYITKDGGIWDGSNVTVYGFVSNPYLLGNSNFARRVGYRVSDVNYYPSLPDLGVAIEGVLGEDLDPVNYTLSENIGIEIVRLAGGTVNTGIQCDSPVKLYSDTNTFTAAPGSILTVSGTHTLDYTAPTVTALDIAGTWSFADAAFAIGAWGGLKISPTLQNTAALSGTMFNFNFLVYAAPTYKAVTNTVDLQTIRHFASNPHLTRTGGGVMVIGEFSDFHSTAIVDAGCGIVQRFGVHIDDATGAGEITANVGVRIEALAFGDTNVGIQNLSTSHLIDKVTVGSDTDGTYLLNVRGGNSATNALGLQSSTTGPATPSGLGMQHYVGSGGNHYLLIAYNDAGTTRYRYMQLNGTTATWTHATTLPT